MIEQIQEQCPVCGMKVNSEVAAMEHHKRYFHFCSEQCRETFEADPRLYTTGLAKKSGPLIKNRRLHLAELLEAGTAEAVEEHIGAMMGVSEVKVEDRWLSVGYDLLQVTQARIERVLDEISIPLDKRWWQRLRRGLVHNAEDNELDNLTAPPAPCCNKPPPGVR